MLFTSISSVAQIVVENASSNTADNVSSLSVSHTVNTSNNRLLLVGVSLRRNKADAQVSSVTYGGTPMNQVGTQIVDGDDKQGRVYIFSLVAPAVGTANVVANFSSNPDRGVVVGAVSFSDVDQISPLGGFFSSQGSSNNPSLEVTSATDELVFDVITFKKESLTVGAGQTQRYNGFSGDEMYGASSTKPGTSTTTMSWSPSGSDKWAMGAVSIRPNPCPVTADVNAHPSLGTSNTGEINITNPVGATNNNYQYRLDNGAWQSSPNFTDLAIGFYSVFIRDANEISCERSLGSFEVELDTDGDGVADSNDLDSDNDGILDSDETECFESPELLSTASQSATGSGVSGTPSLTYEVPQGTNRLMIVVATFERDHSNGVNWSAPPGSEPTLSFGSSTNNTPGWVWSRITEDNDAVHTFRSFAYYFDEADIPTGSNAFTFSGAFNNPQNAGDEANISVFVYNGVFNWESFSYVDSYDFNTNTSPTVQPPSQSMLSPNQQFGTNESQNTLFNFSVTSNQFGFVPDSDWQTVFQTTVNNENGDYASKNYAVNNSSENDGISLLAQSITGVTGMQTANISSAIPSNLKFLHTASFTTRIYGCPRTDTDGDGVPDYLDSDSDNDGIPDAIEAGANPTDIDSDGRLLGGEDADGVPLVANGGFTLIDSDSDGISDFRDLDSDNDGIPDNVEGQATVGYVVPANDNQATYAANNGINSAYVSNLVFPVDTDGDGIPDFLDSDSDNDGLTDLEESFSSITPGGDVGINGLFNNAETTDDYTDVSGLAHDGTTFALLDTDNLVQTNGIDYDYRRIDTGEELFGTRIISSLQNGTVTPNKIDAYLNIVANNWGVVITRVNGIANITNAVEGMLVFDTSDNTFKICTEGGATPTWRALGE